MNTTPHHTPPRYFTSSDIAAHFGVTVAAVSNWRRRYGSGSPTPFPAPDEDHPIPLWQQDRWPEIDAWQERRRGSRRGPRTTLLQQPDGLHLSIATMAEKLNVTPATVRRWRRIPMPTPFPLPDKEIIQKTRTIPLWREEQWPDIQAWREWHLTSGAGRQRSTRASQHEVPSGQDPQATLPPPSHYLNARRGSSRTGVRRGHVRRASVRRMVR
ncbi:hypothetical protein [Actinophytocola sp.]|uniref:hypothetical protein n=1 Tax=Actinophytocola sp. TaxID=1872138 RepID=UPI00389A59A1